VSVTPTRQPSSEQFKRDFSLAKDQAQRGTKSEGQTGTAESQARNDIITALVLRRRFRADATAARQADSVPGAGTTAAPQAPTER